MIHDDLIAAGIKLTPEQRKARHNAQNTRYYAKPGNKPKAKAKAKAYYQKHKTEVRAKRATTEAKARRKTWRWTPKQKAKSLARGAAWRPTPEAKAYMEAYRSTPEYKEKMKVYWSTPEAKAYRIAHSCNTPIEIPNRPHPVDNRCECCGEISAKTLHLDHCHDTGRFRGWCCWTCNSGAGITDHPERMRKRLAYLERPMQAGPVKWAYPKGWKERNEIREAAAELRELRGESKSAPTEPCVVIPFPRRAA
jgi:hypothetical protein